MQNLSPTYFFSDIDLAHVCTLHEMEHWVIELFILFIVIFVACFLWRLNFLQLEIHFTVKAKKFNQPFLFSNHKGTQFAIMDNQKLWNLLSISQCILHFHLAKDTSYKYDSLPQQKMFLYHNLPRISIPCLLDISLEFAECTFGSQHQTGTRPLSRWVWKVEKNLFYKRSFEFDWPIEIAHWLFDMSHFGMKKLFSIRAHWYVFRRIDGLP